MPFSSCTVSRKNAFLLKLIEIRRNTKKALNSRSQLLILYNSQTFLTNSNTDFVKEVTKAFFLLIFLRTNKKWAYQKPVSRHWSQFASKITCRQTVMQLSIDELQQKRYAVHCKQIFLVVEESTLSGIQCLNILVERRPVICSSPTCTTVNLYCVRQIAILLLKQLTILLNLLESTKVLFQGYHTIFNTKFHGFFSDFSMTFIKTFCAFLNAFNSSQ